MNEKELTIACLQQMADGAIIQQIFVGDGILHQINGVTVDSSAVRRMWAAFFIDPDGSGTGSAEFRITARGLDYLAEQNAASDSERRAMLRDAYARSQLEGRLAEDEARLDAGIKHGTRIAKITIALNAERAAHNATKAALEEAKKKIAELTGNSSAAMECAAHDVTKAALERQRKRSMITGNVESKLKMEIYKP